MKIPKSTTFTTLLLFLATVNFSAERISGQARNLETPSPHAADEDRWKPLRFLLGEWVAVTGSGKPGEAVSGATSFAFDLGESILVRRSRADYAPGPGQKTGLSHTDLMVAYQRQGESQFRAFYVDSEGHDISYRISFPGEGRAVFESEAGQPGPRYRLENELNSDGTLTITFSMAMPGGEFAVYTKGTVRRK